MEDILASNGEMFPISGADSPKTSISIKLMYFVRICTTTCVPTISVFVFIGRTWPLVPGPGNVPKRVPPVYSTSVVDGNPFPTQIFTFFILSPQQLARFVIRIPRTIDRGITTVTQG